MQTNIVVGLGFGDEGKGITTDYLCLQSKSPVVVRFNGGHQAGHTVETLDGKRHVFSSFGSGTLRGVPTYWSSYCTFYPPGFLNELEALQAITEGMPRFYLDALAPVTTFYDVIFNRCLESSRSDHAHGSCGLGFGATIERHESQYEFTAQDLLSPHITCIKLNAIRQYYDEKVKSFNSPALTALYNDYDFERATELFTEAIQECISHVEFVQEKDFFTNLKQSSCETLIFEGAQGILLDMDFGFFPHVTRSHTTTKNAMEIIRRNHLPNPSIYYVTRTYQTRHGAGPMTNESIALRLENNNRETNVYNQWQGHLRISVLDIDLLKYALLADHLNNDGLNKILVITCLDHVDHNIKATFKRHLSIYTCYQLAKEIVPDASGLLLSSSAYSENMEFEQIVINQEKIKEL